MTLGDVLFLLRIDLLAGGVREVSQWNSRHVDMGLRVGAGLRHDDMRMNVDRGR